MNTGPGPAMSLAHWFPPRGAYVQDIIQSVQTVPSGGPVTFVTAYEFDTPQEQLAQLGWLGIESNDPSAGATVTWRFLIDNSAHYNYNAPPVFLGTVDDPAHIYIAIEGAHHVALQFSDTALLAGHTMFFRLFYWFWNPKLYAHPMGVDEQIGEGV
jgi:hypothetical protein